MNGAVWISRDGGAIWRRVFQPLRVASDSVLQEQDSPISEESRSNFENDATAEDPSDEFDSSDDSGETAFLQRFEKVEQNDATSGRENSYLDAQLAVGDFGDFVLWHNGTLYWGDEDGVVIGRVMDDAPLKLIIDHQQSLYILRGSGIRVEERGGRVWELPSVHATSMAFRSDQKVILLGEEVSVRSFIPGDNIVSPPLIEPGEAVKLDSWKDSIAVLQETRLLVYPSYGEAFSVIPGHFSDVRIAGEDRIFLRELSGRWIVVDSLGQQAVDALDVAVGVDGTVWVARRTGVVRYSGTPSFSIGESAMGDSGAAVVSQFEDDVPAVPFTRKAAALIPDVALFLEAGRKEKLRREDYFTESSFHPSTVLWFGVHLIWKFKPEKNLPSIFMDMRRTAKMLERRKQAIALRMQREQLRARSERETDSLSLALIRIETEEINSLLGELEKKQ